MGKKTIAAGKARMPKENFAAKSRPLPVVVSAKTLYAERERVKNGKEVELFLLGSAHKDKASKTARGSKKGISSETEAKILSFIAMMDNEPMGDSPITVYYSSWKRGNKKASKRTFEERALEQKR